MVRLQALDTNDWLARSLSWWLDLLPSSAKVSAELPTSQVF